MASSVPQNGDVITVEVLRAAMEKMKQNGAPEPHWHLVHPSAIRGRRLAETIEDLRNPEARTFGCASCFGAIVTVPND